MADTDDRADNQDEEQPPIIVPSHNPLPPPPDIQFTRPRLGQRTDQAATGFDSGLRSGPGFAVKYSAGLAGSISFGACIIAGYLIGSFIDKHWIHAPTPWATIVMVLAGTGLGFYNLIRMVNRSENRDNK